MLLSFVHPGNGSWTRAYPLRTRSRNSCVGRCNSCTHSTSGVNSVRNLSRAGARAGQRSVSQMLQVMIERRVGTIFSAMLPEALAGIGCPKRRIAGRHSVLRIVDFQQDQSVTRLTHQESLNSG